MVRVWLTLLGLVSVTMLLMVTVLLLIQSTVGCWLETLLVVYIYDKMDISRAALQVETEK
jgi:hypothetical protein